MKRQLGCVLFLVWACGGSAEPGLSGSCAVTAAGPPAPVPDPNGPYYHQVVLARSADGVTLTGARQVLDHASVPDGVVGPDGATRVYYVNGADGTVWVARVNADSVIVVGALVLDGVERPAGVVDPDGVLLADGRIRLFYLSGFGSPDASRPRTICHAESTDGLRFTVGGPAVVFPAGSTVTDPSVTRLADGSWLMALSLGQRTILARSAEGQQFQVTDTVSFGGVPEVATLADGRIRLYVCAGGIVSYLSGDGGRSWARETTVVAPGTGGKRIICDPSRVAGTEWFIYKTGD